MFTVEIRINGAMIAHIYGRNLMTQDNGLDLYDYEYYEPEKPALSRGKVSHARENGIRQLVKIILADVDKQEQKTKKKK